MKYILFGVGMLISLGLSAEEKKREPATTDGMKIQTILNAREGQAASRIIDSKTNIICYTATNRSTGGGTSIWCTKAMKLPE